MTRLFHAIACVDAIVPHDCLYSIRKVSRQVIVPLINARAILKDIETCHRVIDKCLGLNKKCHDISNANARLDIKYIATNICEKNN